MDKGESKELQGKRMPSPKLNFALLVSLLMMSSVLVFPFFATVLLLPYVFVTGNNPIIPTKGTFEALLILGVAIQTFIIVFSIKKLYRMTKCELKHELG